MIKQRNESGRRPAQLILAQHVGAV